MGNLSELRQQIFESDDKACFIERERILNRLEQEMADYHAPDRYAILLAKVLAEVSTPVDASDYFAGRIVEARPDAGRWEPSRLLESTGHMNFDYEKILRVGLLGILEEIQAAARQKATDDALVFANNARIVVDAIGDYTARYAKAAEEAGLTEAAKALRRVPLAPAYDFYSALQSIWILHMIASCYVGSRDYAFGRFDSFMLAYYRQALREGHSEQELTELLAGFLMKTNEICGRATYNHDVKPILAQASKQYLTIGGAEPNEFSFVVLNAAKLNNMAQPQIVVLLKPESDISFTQAAFEALSVLTDKMNIYNYELVYQHLKKLGIPEDVARDFTYSACCTFDLNYHSFRQELYLPIPQAFVRTLHSNEFSSLEQLISAFESAVKNEVRWFIDASQNGADPERARQVFVLDGILLSDSAAECRYPCDGRSKYHVLNLFCPGVATIGDSLMVLDKLVFRENRYSYREFMQILRDNYEGHEALLEEIKDYTMFGNDTDADAYTAMAANAILDAIETEEHHENHYLIPGFYSLERDVNWASQVDATPNGRKAGEHFSENQSPSYGADQCGITALLKSVSKLPFDRAVAGGLNLTFSRNMSPEVLRALVVSYFQLGGLHVGITVLDRKTLEDAMIHPEKYQSLTVRLYGFSEYFVSLPKWQQLAILNRTEYA